jgi:signal peptidase I
VGIFGIFGRVVVEGTSMQPTYYPRDWLLIRYRIFKKHLSLTVGDVVVIERELQPGIYYIKRIAEIKNESAGLFTYFVRSDNESGTDSRTWGYLEKEEIVGKVLMRIKRGAL